MRTADLFYITGTRWTELLVPPTAHEGQHAHNQENKTQVRRHLQDHRRQGNGLEEDSGRNAQQKNAQHMKIQKSHAENTESDYKNVLGD